MWLRKRLGEESKLGKSFGGEALLGRFMIGDEEWWMVTFATPFFFFFFFFFFSSSLE
jgi:hypothetical protein